MKMLAVLPYVLGAALVVATYALDQIPTAAGSRSAGPSVGAARTVPASWAPVWLRGPLNRAIADATDPHGHK